jgi:hypothetical protein
MVRDYRQRLLQINKTLKNFRDRHEGFGARLLLKIKTPARATAPALQVKASPLINAL